MSKPIGERHEYVKENALCFSCLRPGHFTKDCNRRHPTSLHEERRDREMRVSNKTREAVSDGVAGEDHHSKASIIVPVWISCKEEPSNEHLVYALLDTQSDTTFILEETSEKLNARSEPVRLKLSTMTSKDQLISG